MRTTEGGCLRFRLRGVLSLARLGQGDVGGARETLGADLLEGLAEGEFCDAVVEVFRAQGFFLEMITCQDRREDLAAMRLVYAFNQLGAADKLHV